MATGPKSFDIPPKPPQQNDNEVLDTDPRSALEKHGPILASRDLGEPLPKPASSPDDKGMSLLDLGSDDVLDLTRHERKSKLEEEIAKLNSQNLLLERQDWMESAQRDYFDEIARYQKERSTLNIAAEGFIGWNAGLPAKAAKLRKEWISARSDLYFAEKQTAVQRLENRSAERDEALEKRVEGGSKITKEAILKRYERAVMNRTTILGMEEAEQNARREGLGSREKSMLNSALERYKKLPPGLRIVGTSALIMGGSAALTAAVAGSVALAPVALALGGTSAAARWWAETKSSSNPRASKIAKTLSSIPAVTGWLAQKGVELIHKKAGTEQKAQQTLSQTEGFSISSESDFASVAKERSDALTASERIARDARLARMAGAAVGGAAFGAALHGVHGPGHTEGLAPTGETPPPAHTVEYGPGTKNDLPPDFTREQFEYFKKTGHYPPEDVAANTTPVVSNGSEQAALVPATPHESLAVGGNITTSDQLMGHFREQLQEKYPDPTKAPLSVQEFLRLPQNQDALTLKLGLQDAQGRSFMLHKGDTVSLENGEVVIKPFSGEAHTLINSSGKVQSFDLEKVPHTMTTHTPVEGVAAPQHLSTAENAHAPESAANPVSENLPNQQTTPDSTAVHNEIAKNPELPWKQGSGAGTPEMEKWLSSYNDRHGISALTNDPTNTAEQAFSEQSAAIHTVSEGTPVSTEGITALEPTPSISVNGDHAEASAGATEGAQTIVNPDVPAGYSLHVPGSGEDYPIALGGTEKGASSIAEIYAHTHPGKTMYFVSVKKHFFGGTSTHINAWTSDAEGIVRKITNVPDRIVQLFTNSSAEQNLRALPNQ